MATRFRSRFAVSAAVTSAVLLGVFLLPAAGRGGGGRGRQVDVHVGGQPDGCDAPQPGRRG